MTVKFANTIVFVKDIEKSKNFYTEILGLKIVNDYGTVIMFEDHFVIHNSKSIIKTVFKTFNLRSIFKQGKKNILIYFESIQLNEIFEKVKKSKVKIIHKIEKQAWGQQVFRFFDPDNHLVEIGEPFRLDGLL